ncbi:hypothetical protein ABIE67_010229, partial [Streptomyces sp. V4I8]
MITVAVHMSADTPATGLTSNDAPTDQELQLP